LGEGLALSTKKPVWEGLPTWQVKTVVGILPRNVTFML